MGGVWSLVSSFFGSGVALCDRISVKKNKCICCSSGSKELSFLSDVKNTEDVPTSDHILSDDYYLATHYITRQYYTTQNVAYFSTDPNGIAINGSDNMGNFIGLQKEQNLQSMAWTSSMVNNYEIYGSMLNKAKLKKSYIKKIHFKFVPKGSKNKLEVNKYVIIELHPYYDKDDGRYMGLKGILLNLPYNIWNIFNENYFEEYLNNYNPSAQQILIDNDFRHNSPNREYNSAICEQINSPIRMQEQIDSMHRDLIRKINKIQEESHGYENSHRCNSPIRRQLDKHGKSNTHEHGHGQSNTREHGQYYTDEEPDYILPEFDRECYTDSDIICRSSARKLSPPKKKLMDKNMKIKNQLANASNDMQKNITKRQLGVGHDTKYSPIKIAMRNSYKLQKSKKYKYDHEKSNEEVDNGVVNPEITTTPENAAAN